MPNPEHDPRLLLLSPQDNVLVVCRPVAKGETVRLDGAAITIAAGIQTGHKLARRAIAEAETITKYETVTRSSGQRKIDSASR